MKYAIIAGSVKAARSHLKWVIENTDTLTTRDIVIISTSNTHDHERLRGFDRNGLEVWVCRTIYGTPYWGDIRECLSVCGLGYTYLPDDEC